MEDQSGSYRSIVFTLIGISIGFASSFLSLVFHPKISEIGSGQFWIEETLPLLYWIGIIIVAIFMVILLLGKHFHPLLFVPSAAILVICLRMALPIISASPILYEPDTNNYFTVINSWLKTGLDFGKDGDYQHDYPLAYLIAFFLVKLGIPIDVFLRFAPLFIYVINIFILYFLYNEVTLENIRISSGAVFLFSFSSLGYWMSVHYCPDLIGTTFYLFSLYLSVICAKKHVLEITSIVSVCISIFLLILSHHLSTLYLTLTLLGLSLISGLNKTPELKRQWIRFFVLGIFTYTLWFAYGSFMYPSFFNIYVYLQFSESPVTLAQRATLLDTITFTIYPAFILILYVFSLLKMLKIEKWNLTSFYKLLKGIPMNKESSEIPLIYSVGYIFIVVLFALGFIVPNTLPLRVLEVLFIGIYPISSQTLLKVYGNPSKKKKLQLLVYCLVICFVMLTSIHRYHRQIQGRIAKSAYVN